MPPHPPARSSARPLVSRGLSTFVLGLVLGLTGVLFGAASPAAARVLDDFGAYQPQVSCDPVAKPGVLAFRSLMLSKFGGGDLGITRDCASGGLSEHKEGRAWDWALNYRDPADRVVAAHAIHWLTKTVDGEPAANARRLGIMYMIWDGKIWGAYRASEGWRPYTGADGHTSHIHLSFTWNGATGHTSYWTGQVEPYDYGPCQRWVGELARPWTRVRLVPCPVPVNRPAMNARGIYRAQVGETPFRVARWFGLTPAQVRLWNRLPATGPVTLTVGQRLHVRPPTNPPVPPVPPNTPPVPTPPTPPVPANPVYYTVRPGDTLYNIATNQHSPVTRLRKWNHLNGALARAGQVLRVGRVLRVG